VGWRILISSYSYSNQQQISSNSEQVYEKGYIAAYSRLSLGRYALGMQAFPARMSGWASRYLQGKRNRLVRFSQNQVMGLRRDTTLHTHMLMQEMQKKKARVVWW
jgi:hypothetical protein